MNDLIHSRLEHFPVALFSTVMGMMGLTLVWKKASEVLGAYAIIWHILIVITAVLISVLALAYLLKLQRFPKQVYAEFNHPIKISFFPAFSIGLMLIASALAESMPGLATLIWCLGITLQLLVTLVLINLWIHKTHWQIAHATPAWFIPIVGNIIAPVAGVALGFHEISWFFFSLGIVFWIVLKVLIFNRIIFHDPIPERLLPTLFILIAPPAVGFIAYRGLNGGVIDNFAHVLYYTAMFLVLLLFSQINYFRKLPFFVSWWAYSFPLAAFTVGTLIMFEHQGSVFYQALSLVMLVLVSVLLGLLIYKTIRSAISGELFQAD